MTARIRRGRTCLRSTWKWLIGALALTITCCNSLAADSSLAPATIVVFNRDDPESTELAKFYAQQRGIARDHLVGLACSREEEITREEYDRTIAEPLREIFRQREWWTLRETAEQQPAVVTNSIRFVALIKGIPLKVRPASGYPGDEPGTGMVEGRSDASVDSELSVLGRFSKEISGAQINSYFQSYKPILEFGDPRLMLVCRLDAPTAATVRRMIVDAIETEKSGLWGRAFVDGAQNKNGGWEIGDRWLAEIPEQLRKAGIPVVYDDAAAIFPDGFPVTDCALYYGWYSAAVAGPFAQPGFRFLPGAIAVHIHSFSANTLRDPFANWAGPLLVQGAAATLGNVYEPYLQLTTHLNVFNDRLLHGFTFAESAYMASEALSWMPVMVGDPLYRPYASWLQLEARPERGGAVSDWKMYHEFAVKNGSRPAPEFRSLARQAALRARNAPMIEDLGLMEARDGNFPSATRHFQQARSLYTQRDDLLRVVLEEAGSWIKQNKKKRALDLVRSVTRIVSEGPTAAMLKKLEADLRPPAATPRPKR